MIKNEQLQMKLGDESAPDADRRMVRQTLDAAYERFLERDEIYQGLWKDGGWPDSANHVRHKAARVARCVTGRERPEQLVAAMDDAMDLINYATFFILNVSVARVGEPTG